MSVAVREVSFRYPASERDLLSQVSFEVPSASSLAVMGPSGRGKSTLLAIAGLLLAPTHGEVLIDGKPRTPRDAPLLLGRSVGWIFQSVNLLPRRTVLENCMLPLLAAGTPRSLAHREATRRLEQVGIDPLDDRQARTLSGGEAQRVGVARALTTTPSVLLADEPTANLEAANAEIVARALVAASAETALVLATHDDAIAALAGSVLRLGER